MPINQLSTFSSICEIYQNYIRIWTVWSNIQIGRVFDVADIDATQRALCHINSLLSSSLSLSIFVFFFCGLFCYVPLLLFYFLLKPRCRYVWHQMFFMRLFVKKLNLSASKNLIWHHTKTTNRSLLSICLSLSLFVCLFLLLYILHCLMVLSHAFCDMCAWIFQYHRFACISFYRKKNVILFLYSPPNFCATLLLLLLT